MGSNFWRFASTLEKEFKVPYDRDREVVLCPECRSLISKAEIEPYSYIDTIDEGNLVFKCPYCQNILTSVPFVE